MPHKQASTAEFHWRGDELHHVPTNTKFLVHAGKVEAISTELPLHRLHDGSDYDVESVLDLAWRLAEQRALDE